MWHQATGCVSLRLLSLCSATSSNRNSHSIIAPAIRSSNSFRPDSCLEKRDHAGKRVVKVPGGHCGWTLLRPHAVWLASAEFGYSQIPSEMAFLAAASSREFIDYYFQSYSHK